MYFLKNLLSLWHGVRIVAICQMLDVKLELSPIAFKFFPSPRYGFGLPLEKKLMQNHFLFCRNGSSSASQRHLKEIPIVLQFQGYFSTAVTNTRWNANKRWGMHIYGHWAWKQAPMARPVLPEGTRRNSRLSENLKVISPQQWPIGDKMQEKVWNVYSWAWNHAAMARRVFPRGTWRKSQLSDNLKVISPQQWPIDGAIQTNKFLLMG